MPKEIQGERKNERGERERERERERGERVERKKCFGIDGKEHVNVAIYLMEETRVSLMCCL